METIPRLEASFIPKNGEFKAQSIKQKSIFSAFNTVNWGQFPIYGGKFQ